MKDYVIDGFTLSQEYPNIIYTNTYHMPKYKAEELIKSKMEDCRKFQDDNNITYKTCWFAFNGATKYNESCYPDTISRNFTNRSLDKDFPNIVYIDIDTLTIDRAIAWLSDIEDIQGFDMFVGYNVMIICVGVNNVFEYKLKDSNASYDDIIS